MPRHRIGPVPMSPAERQARPHWSSPWAEGPRTKLRQQLPRPPTTRVRRSAPRPTRWAAAVATLVSLQEEYRAWLDNLPPNLENSTLVDKLQTMVELDLEALQ